MADHNHREDNVVYFTGYASQHSWAGVIDDGIDMTDEMVNDYVKDTNPELFKKLRGMRFGSSDIPLTFKPQRDLRRLDNMDSGSQVERWLSRQVSNSPTEISRQKTLTSLNFRQSAEGSQVPRSSPRVRKSSYAYAESQDQLKLDGVDRQTVLSSAGRLYPNVSAAENVPASFRDKHVEPDHASKYVPNSKSAHELRALKQLEINETLAEVSKYEKALRAAKSQLHQLQARDPSPDATVLITKPFYMEPRKDRYKKQGYTPYDRARYQRALRRERQAYNAETPHLNSLVVSSPTPDVRYCYCREPDDGSEMVRCSKQWCPVGWFHLRCTGLDRLPYLYEEFHCCYCGDGIGPLVTRNLLEGTVYPWFAIAQYHVEQVAECYRNSDMETEVVFLEQDDRRGAKRAYRSTVYDDDYVNGPDEEGSNDNCFTLHEKISKWRAINNPYETSTVSNANLTTTGDDTLGADLSIHLPGDDSEDSSQDLDEMQGLLFSDPSITRASSTVIGDEIEADASVDETGDTTEMDDAGFNAKLINSTKCNDWSGQKISQINRLDSAHTMFPIFNGSIYHAMNGPLHKPLAIPQPSTITDSTPFSSNNSTLSSSRNNLPVDLHAPDDTDTIVCPRTPLLAPRTAENKSKNPWGTPINIGTFITEPTSPSPASKIQLANVDYENQDDYDMMVANANNRLEVDEIADSQDEDEEVPFMLDPRTPWSR